MQVQKFSKAKVILIIAFVIVHLNMYLFPGSTLIRHLVLFAIVGTICTTSLYNKKHKKVLVYVCAWCRNIKVSQNATNWLTFEKHLLKEYNVESSHGICPVCFENNLYIERQQNLAETVPESQRSLNPEHLDRVLEGETNDVPRQVYSGTEKYGENFEGEKF